MEETKKTEAIDGTPTLSGGKVEALLNALNSGTLDSALNFDDAMAVAELTEVLREIFTPLNRARTSLIRKYARDGERVELNGPGGSAFVKEVTALFDKPHPISRDRISKPLPLKLPPPAKIEPSTLLACRGSGLIEFVKPGPKAVE